MHDGMLYDPIQGQGHECFKIESHSRVVDHHGTNLLNVEFCAHNLLTTLCARFCITCCASWISAGHV